MCLFCGCGSSIFAFILFVKAGVMVFGFDFDVRYLFVPRSIFERQASGVLV